MSERIREPQAGTDRADEIPSPLEANAGESGASQRPSAPTARGSTENDTDPDFVVDPDR